MFLGFPSWTKIGGFLNVQSWMSFVRFLNVHLSAATFHLLSELLPQFQPSGSHKLAMIRLFLLIYLRINESINENNESTWDTPKNLSATNGFNFGVFSKAISWQDNKAGIRFVSTTFCFFLHNLQMTSGNTLQRSVLLVTNITFWHMTSGFFRYFSCRRTFPYTFIWRLYCFSFKEQTFELSLFPSLSLRSGANKWSFDLQLLNCFCSKRFDINIYALKPFSHESLLSMYFLVKEKDFCTRKLFKAWCSFVCFVAISAFIRFSQFPCFINTITWRLRWWLGR